jgi:hypothetical protein
LHVHIVVGVVPNGFYCEIRCSGDRKDAAGGRFEEDVFLDFPAPGSN